MIALVVLVVTLALATVAITATLSSRSHATRDLRSQRALQAADAGVNSGIYRFNQVNLANFNFTGGSLAPRDAARLRDSQRQRQRRWLRDDHRLLAQGRGLGGDRRLYAARRVERRKRDSRHRARSATTRSTRCSSSAGPRQPAASSVRTSFCIRRSSRSASRTPATPRPASRTPRPPAAPPPGASCAACWLRSRRSTPSRSSRRRGNLAINAAFTEHRGQRRHPYQR